MKLLITLLILLAQASAYGQQNVTITFENDYPDAYRLALIIYTPDGKNQTRVGDLQPRQTKSYTLPAGTEVYVADWKQEAFAMKGNDIKATGLAPTYILSGSKPRLKVALTTIGTSANVN